MEIPAASDSRISVLPLFRGAGSWPPSHPPARIWGDFLLLLRAWVKRTAVHRAIELVPRGERRTAVRALSIFANVSSWSREGCIASKLGAPISTPTRSRSPLLYPTSTSPYPIRFCHSFFFFLLVFIVPKPQVACSLCVRILPFSGYRRGDGIFLEGY